ncbi:MAG: M1 family metallopeptidase [Bryobacteraceae bacterium]
MNPLSIAMLLASFLVFPVASNAQTAAPKLRLPETVRPIRYSASLRMVPGEDRFTGYIEIDLDVLQPTSTVWLHAKSLEFRGAAIMSNDVNLPVEIKPGTDDFVAFTALGELHPKAPATLTISYTGEISRTLTDGAFQQKQGNDWYIFTKFEPVTARRVFPCFDEPSYKTAWKLILHVPRNLKAFSNTPIASEEDESDGMKAVRFQQTKPLPSYLVAFAAGPFDIVETEPVGKNRTPSRIVVPRTRAPEASYAASITPKLIEMLEQYFGTPYPYEKLDQIVVPLTTAWGAMENAGLIAYGDFLLSPKQDDTELRRRGRAGAMEHEMSHQWFGDLVTTAWWDDIWLNEAFASWLSTKLLNEWKPEWQMKTDAARSAGIMRADSLTTSRKIRQPIEAHGDIANAFDGITYGKGEAVIGMFENYIGPEKFQQAIRLYLQQHAWGNATSTDLLAALDKIAGPVLALHFRHFSIKSASLGWTLHCVVTASSRESNCLKPVFSPWAPPVRLGQSGTFQSAQTGAANRSVCC